MIAENTFEACSAYLQDGDSLKLIHTENVNFNHLGTGK